MDAKRETRISGQVIGGVFLVLLGCLFLLDNLNIIDGRYGLRFWPVLMIAAGVVKLLVSRERTERLNGIFWIGLGALLLAWAIGYVHTNVWRLVWPAIIIWVGAAMLSRPRPPGERFTMNSSESINATAVMSGFESKSNSKEFRGGDVTAFMGYVKGDFREAVMEKDEAILNVFSLMGNIELFVPPDWIVETRLTPFMAACEDKTGTQKGATKRLVVTGFMMMSNLEVMN